MTSGSSETPVTILLGYGPTALTALRSLLQSCCVAAVVRDTSSSVEDPVGSFAQSEGVPIYAISRSQEIGELIKSSRADAVVISSFNRIIPAELLRLTRFVNVHYSPLPRYRGRANVNWALINGEPSAAISIHMVVPGLDSGNLLYQEEIPINPADTAGALYERLNAIQERELGAAILRMLLGDEGRQQNHTLATYGCARVPADGEIDWRSSTAAIDRLIRALTPSPGAFTFFETERLAISRAVPLSDPPVYEGRVPGRVSARSSLEGWVDILTADGILRLLEVIDSSGKTLLPASLLKSTRATLGLSKADLLDRISALEARLASFECSQQSTGDSSHLRASPTPQSTKHHNEL